MRDHPHSPPGARTFLAFLNLSHCPLLSCRWTGSARLDYYCNRKSAGGMHTMRTPSRLPNMLRPPVRHLCFTPPSLIFLPWRSTSSRDKTQPPPPLPAPELWHQAGTGSGPTPCWLAGSQPLQTSLPVCAFRVKVPPECAQQVESLSVVADMLLNCFILYLWQQLGRGLTFDWQMDGLILPRPTQLLL